MKVYELNDVDITFKFKQKRYRLHSGVADHEHDSFSYVILSLLGSNERVKEWWEDDELPFTLVTNNAGKVTAIHTDKYIIPVGTLCSMVDQVRPVSHLRGNPAYMMRCKSLNREYHNFLYPVEQQKRDELQREDHEGKQYIKHCRDNWVDIVYGDAL